MLGFYRHMEVKLDLGFVNDWVDDCPLAQSDSSLRLKSPEPAPLASARQA